MIEYAEKRDLMRMPIDCDLSITPRGSDRPYVGHVINLSGKGIFFTSKRSYELGSVLDIVLTPSNSATQPIFAEAIVTRVGNNEVLYEIACEIDDIK